MFHHEFHHIATQAEIEHQQRVYAKKKAALEAEIGIENEKLDSWLKDEENKSKTHYGLVEGIFNCFHRENKDHDEWLHYYWARREDMAAVNDAISGKGTDALQARANENMESNSPALEVTGVLMGALAVTLIVSGLFLLNPLIFYFGLISALSAYSIYTIGATKVSTEKSGLFNDLKEKISPTPPSMSHDLEQPMAMDSLFVTFPYVRSMYG